MGSNARARSALHLRVVAAATGLDQSPDAVLGKYSLQTLSKLQIERDHRVGREPQQKISQRRNRNLRRQTLDVKSPFVTLGLSQSRQSLQDRGDVLRPRPQESASHRLRRHCRGSL